MKKQEPRKHHYIPRFILKNFNDDKGQVNYWDIKKNKLEKRNIKSVFMNIDMYRDETINEQDPTQIESKFSIFECEIAKLISEDIAPDTPLQKNLAKTSKILGIVALSICFIIFIIGVIQGRPLFDMFMTSVSLAVASIPF